MHNKNKVSTTQLKALIVTVVIGTGILSLPSSIADLLDNDGWLGILLGGLIASVCIIVIDRLFKLYPDKDFTQLGEEILNSTIFKIILAIYFTYAILILSINVRDFAEIIKSYLLETTPKEIVIITMLLATSYIARSEIEVMARMAVIIYPIILVFIIFFATITIPSVDFSNLLPVFQLNFKSLIKGGLITFYAFGGYEFILLVLPIVENKEATLNSSLRGIFTVTIIYLIVFFITLSQYGIHQLKREIWPTIAIVKEISLPGYFLENLDGIVMAVWIMVVYGTVGPFLHFASFFLSKILNTKEHQYLVLPLIPFIYILCQYPRDLAQLSETIGIALNYFSLFTLMILPIILLISGLIKSRRKNQ